MKGGAGARNSSRGQGEGEGEERSKEGGSRKEKGGVRNKKKGGEEEVQSHSSITTCFGGTAGTFEWKGFWYKPRSASLRMAKKSYGGVDRLEPWWR